jgi:hypothetical protein
VSQTTKEGKPLSEKVTGRTFFTFDKTFGEDSNTEQVYDSVARGIVSSVVNGLNGTIFAYTDKRRAEKPIQCKDREAFRRDRTRMEVSCTWQQKIFFHTFRVSKIEMFLVRASILEIYNEDVRDLLSNSNQTLQVREDPRLRKD